MASNSLSKGSELTAPSFGSIALGRTLPLVVGASYTPPSTVVEIEQGIDNGEHRKCRGIRPPLTGAGVGGGAVFGQLMG